MILRIVTVLFLFSSAVFGVIQDHPDMIHYLDRAELFKGDRHGDFKGDFLVTLEDGSSWKVHPKHKEIFSTWDMGDPVHVEVRTSFYWYKREHKFSLYNHNRNESVFVMLIGYGDFPLEIAQTNTYSTGSYTVPVYNYPENRPKEVLFYTNVASDHKTDLLLSDGTTFTINKKSSPFRSKSRVYKGFKDNYFFLITGTEREAEWCWLN